MPKYDYLVVGSGLYGSVFAHEITKTGKKCLVIDQRPHIGGNVYTEPVNGITVHRYGAHIFHTDKKYIWDYINSFGRLNNFINSPIAIIDHKSYNLPFNMNTFSRVFGTVRPEETQYILDKETAPYKDIQPVNLEEQALKLVGPTIYEMFIKNYTYKQWDKPCTQLPAYIIKRLPIRLTYNNNYFDDPFQGIPQNGYTPIIEKLLSGIEVKLNTPYEPNMATLANKIIYTGKIDDYYNNSYGDLEYRSLKFVDIDIDSDNYQGNAVFNYPTTDQAYIRSVEHKHFTPDLKTKNTIVSYEYSVAYKRGLEAFYPIYTEANEGLYNIYNNLAKNETNILFKGRLGNFKYFDMDDTIYNALELVKDELNG